jgi:release factor glutamine methyltransferase
MQLEEISFIIPPSVYLPREDSWALAKSLPFVKGKKCLDMGCGAGVQTAALLLNGAEKVTSVDKAPVALETAKQNLLPHFDASKIDFVESNLFENVKGSYHFMVFNPPYVPSMDVRWGDTDGGKKGRETIDRFLDQFHLFLEEDGVCYLLQSSRNSLKLTQEKAFENGFSCAIVQLLDVPGEELQIIKLERTIPGNVDEESPSSQVEF